MLPFRPVVRDIMLDSWPLHLFLLLLIEDCQVKDCDPNIIGALHACVEMAVDKKR